MELFEQGRVKKEGIDYLDGFSKAANPELKDHYYKYSIGLQYALRDKSNYDCPVIHY